MTQETPQRPAPELDDKVDLAELSRAMVRHYKEQFGRGPTKARTTWSGSDIIVSTLEDTLTPAERNMVKAGEHQRLRDLRLYFQYACEHELIGMVERISGRRVRAFISGMDVVRDVATEVFHLEPRGERPDPRPKDEMRP